MKLSQIINFVYNVDVELCNRTDFEVFMLTAKDSAVYSVVSSKTKPNHLVTQFVIFVSLCVHKSGGVLATSIKSIAILMHLEWGMTFNWRNATIAEKTYAISFPICT